MVVLFLMLVKVLLNIVVGVMIIVIIECMYGVFLYQSIHCIKEAAMLTFFNILLRNRCCIAGPRRANETVQQVIVFPLKGLLHLKLTGLPD